MTHTHVGARGATGHYAVTADAYRTPGRRHALNLAGHRFYRGLCGVSVHRDSGDHFVGENPIYPAGERKVTCKRCLKKLVESK